jgi:glycosyltransferase involved in cell wall biosynthesis
MPDPRLSVVIPVLNGADTIAAQLDALAVQKWSEPWEVVVADNGSTDGTRELVESYRGRLPDLRIADASAKRSQAYAMNVGVREARAEAIAFCDADDRVRPGWVAAMGEALAEHGFVASRIDDRELNEPWVRESRDPILASSLPTLWFPPHVAFAAGGGLGVRRSVHDAVGGLDESFARLEDLDYCVRIQLAWTPLVMAADAVVDYRYRDTLRGIFRQAYLYGFGMAAVEARHGERRAWRPWRPAAWLVDGWKPLFGLLPRLGRRGRRARLAWLVGWQVGRYHGSFRHRILAS